MKKRVLSFVMAMLMVFSLMPVSVFATEAEVPAVCAAEGCIVLGEHTEHMYASAGEQTDTPVIEDTSAPAGDDTVVPAGEDTDAVEGESTDAVEGESTDAVEGEDTDVVEGESTDAVEGESTDAVEGESTDAVEGEDTDAVAGEDTDAVEGESTEEPKVCIENCILAEGHDGDCYVCEEGCILEGEAEHEENSWECFVWSVCTLTEGCELAAGHPGECTGMSVFADATITVQTGSGYGRYTNLANKYIVVNDGTSDQLYYTNGSGVIVHTDGSTATFDEGTYTIYYAYNNQGSGGWGGGSVYCYKGTATVSGTSASVTATLSSASYGNKPNDNSYTAEQYRYATSVYYNKSSFDHIDVRVAGSYVLNIGGQSYTATVSNPKAVIKLNGSVYQTSSWSGTTSYEWRKTGLSLPKSSTITLELTLDLTYTNGDGEKVTMKDVIVVYDNVNNVHEFIEAVAICDMVQGLDFTVDVQDIQESLEYYTVHYEWRVYNADGTYTNLPAGAPAAPASESGIQQDTEYVYNTTYVTGTSFTDYETGLLYTFHGWDTWSHYSTFNVNPNDKGYHALDDGDTDASNNEPITIKADTYIYGYWTVEQLPPVSAHVAIEKNFAGDEYAIEQAKDLYFQINPGIDLDGDGVSRVDVDYAMIEAGGGEYKIPVYQYDTPYVFTEMNADVPGYTRTTAIAVSGSNASGDATSGDTVNVTLTEEYQGSDVHLGTVTYTNTYTKNVGDKISVYPQLTLWKSETGVASALAGAQFTLYSDAALQNAVGTYTTADDGSVLISFMGLTAGTYYLQETKAPAGYVKSDAVYEVVLTAGAPVEELRWNETDSVWEYAEVTYYTLFVKTEGTSAVFHSTASQSLETATAQYSLNVYNDPIAADLNLSKATVGLADEDKANLSAAVIVRGPITRENGEITALGNTYELTLDSTNNWAAVLENLRYGEYLIHEEFASVHNYTWKDVQYGSLTKLDYNGMSYALFKVENGTAINLELTNTYEEWTAGDFYIKKVNAAGDTLAGAEFQLFTDETCKNAATPNGTQKAVTDEYGYAHFSGYKAAATYYLKETKAPAGYYLDETVYKVEITTTTDENGHTSYDVAITKADGSDAGFDSTHDLLTVENKAIKGQLTVTKKFANDRIPEGMASVDIIVTGPNNYYKTSVLSAANNWTVIFTDLDLGTYTVTESNAQVPGYDLAVEYSSRAVTLADENNGMTASGEVVSGSVTVTNTYTRNDEYFEIPTSLSVLKVDENGQPLAGATFTLTRDDGASASFTTNAEGIVKFDLMSGYIEDNVPENAEYTLVETSAPVGYVPSETEWKVIVEENDGKLAVVLHADANHFDNFWEWIISGITGKMNGSGWKWDNSVGVLTVANTKVLGELTVSKTEVGTYTAGEVTVNVTGPNGYNETIIFSDTNGWSKTLTNLELGEYSVTEAALDMDGTGYTYHVSMKDTDGTKISGTEVDGEVLLDISEHDNYVVSAAVEITNTYEKVTGDDVHVYPDFKVYKTDDQRNPLAGATFQLAGAELAQNLILTADANGMLTFEDLKPGTYTLTELTAPAGYAKDDSVYEVVVSVKNGYPVEQLVSGKHIMHYEYAIAVTKSGAAVTTPNDTLTVMNYKVSGELTITKHFDANTATKPAAVYVNVIGPDGKTAEYTLNDINNWTVKLSGLALGNYVVQEKDASIDGYKLTTSMQDTDGKVTYGSASDGRVALAVGDLEAGFTAAVVSSTVAITNNYVKNNVKVAEILPDLTLYKLRTGTTNVMLEGAQFVISGPDGFTKTVTTDAEGKLVVEDLKPGTYTLTETVAPEGYGITANTYTIKVEQVSDSGEVLQADGTWLRTYGYDITSVTDTNTAVEVRFVEETNTLAVFNSVDEGSITITKDFGVNSELKAADFPNSKFTFIIKKADGSAAVDMDGNEVAPVTLSEATGWTVTVNHLPLGEYIVTEIIEDNADHEITSTGLYLYDTNKDGVIDSKDTAYKWTYASDPNGGKVNITSDDEKDTVAITNTFSEIEPAGFDILKVDAETKAPLEGAQFALYRKGESTALATYTTTADGIVSFSGFLNDGEYILKEVKAPANYDLAAKNEWAVAVDRYNVSATEEAVKITIDGADKTNAVLEVENSRTLGKLVINKAVSYGSLTAAQINELPAAYRPDSYTFKVTILDGSNAYWNGYNAKEITVPANDSLEISDIPYGYTYSVQEVTTGAVFTSKVTNGGGTIGANNVVSAVNTYTIITETPGMNIVKHESETPQVIAGAEFALYEGSTLIDTAISDADGRLNLDLPAANKTYTLKETKPADGYHENNASYVVTTTYDYEVVTIDGKPVIKQIVVIDASNFNSYETMKLTNPGAAPADYEFHVINTKIKPVILSAEKVWSDDNYHARPDSVTVKLYKDDKSTAAVEKELHSEIVLNASNNWRHVWNGGIAAGLTDEYNWTVEEAAVSGYNSSYEVNDGHWVFTNTRNPNPIELTVEKKWIDNNDTSYKPASIEVQLLRDGEAYGSVVELSDANQWKHTWKTADDANINDAHVWTVVEIVPEGYKATYSADGWTITNERIIRDISVSVDKTWIHGSNPAANQPTELEVQLVRKEAGVETVVDSVKLNAENAWAYTWTKYTEDGAVKKLTDFYEWEVREVSVEDYKETAHVWTENKNANVTVEITNTFDKAKVTVTKTVEMEYFDEAGKRVPLTECPNYGEFCPEHGICATDEEERAYEFELSYTLNGVTKTETFTLKKDESKDLYIPVGATYTVKELITEKTFWNPEYSENSTGKIDKYDQVTEIAVNNLYVFHDTTLTSDYEEQEDGLFIGSKIDSKTGAVLSGAKFGLYSDRACKTLIEEYSAANGKLELHFTKEGTYYLKELEAPENYKLSDKVYEIEVTAEYGTYKLGNETIIVKILRATSDDLQSVAENNEETYLIPNEEYGKINVSVSKTWLNPKDYTKQPTSIAVVLYRDGVAYETVTLSKDNNWSYRWSDLYEQYQWTVDEPNVPKDYAKKVTHIGNAWVITNAHKDIPLTGDDSNILLWAGAAGVAVVGLGASLVMLLKKRKEEDEQA